MALVCAGLALVLTAGALTPEAPSSNTATRNARVRDAEALTR